MTSLSQFWGRTDAEHGSCLVCAIKEKFEVLKEPHRSQALATINLNKILLAHRGVKNSRLNFTTFGLTDLYNSSWQNSSVVALPYRI